MAKDIFVKDDRRMEEVTYVVKVLTYGEKGQVITLSLEGAMELHKQLQEKLYGD